MHILFLLLAAGASTHCYLIDSVTQLPDGRTVSVSVTLVKRTVDRGAGKIEETVINLRGDDAAKEFVTAIIPAGSKVKISGGGFEGSGEMSGPAWAWTGMKFTLDMGKAGKLEGEDVFRADGMEAHKKMYSPDGKLRVLIEERGVGISQAAFDALRSRLISK